MHFFSIEPFNYSFIHPIIHSFIHSIINSFIHLFIHSFIHSFSRVFAYLALFVKCPLCLSVDLAISVGKFTILSISTRLGQRFTLESISLLHFSCFFFPSQHLCNVWHSFCITSPAHPYVTSEFGLVLHFIASLVTIPL